MTDQEKVQRHVLMDLKSAAAVADKNGKPQWQLETSIPDVSQYPTKFWIDRKDGVPGPEPGKYQALIERGGLVKKRDGSTGDGSQDFHYYWNLKDFAPATSRDTQTAPNSGGAPTSDLPIGKTETERRQESIERQVALKAAVDIVIPVSARFEFTEETNVASGIVSTLEIVKGVATDLYNYLNGATAPPANETTPRSGETPHVGTTAPDEFDALSSPAERTFANVGELLTSALKEYGIERRGVIEIAGTQQLGGEDLLEVWKKIVASVTP